MLLEVMFRLWYFAARVVHSCGNKHICFRTLLFPPILCSVRYGGNWDVNSTGIALTPLGGCLEHTWTTALPLKWSLTSMPFIFFLLSVLPFKFHTFHSIKHYLLGKTIQGLIILRPKVNPCHRQWYAYREVEIPQKLLLCIGK